jgi:DUF4097 and DUF4098 domain-containing protein YvlB
MKRSSILIPLAVTVAAVASAGSAAASTGRDTDRFQFRGVTQIVLDNRQGHVDVTAGGTRAVDVERKTTSLFTKVTQNAYVRNGVLHLTSRCDHVLCVVDYRIAAPAGVRLQVTNRYADVTVKGSPGDVEVVNTDEGDIRLDLAAGKRHVSATTRKGDVTINGHRR